jgi:hypothetical protein
MYSIPDRGLERGGACLDCELVESLLSRVFEYALVAAVHDGQHLHSRRKKIENLPIAFIRPFEWFKPDASSLLRPFLRHLRRLLIFDVLVRLRPGPSARPARSRLG